MSRTPVPFAPDTLESIRRAFRVRRPNGATTWSASSTCCMPCSRMRRPGGILVSLQRRHGRTLRTDLDEVLERAFSPVPGTKAVKPESTLGFDRVVERAVVHAASSSAQQVESGALLVFLLQEEDSHAAYFLSQAGRRSTDAAAGDCARRASASPDVRRPMADDGESGKRSAERLRRRTRGEGRRRGGIDPLIGRAARTRADGPGAVPPPEEQPAARRRAGRGQDRAGRRPGASDSPKATCRTALKPRESVRPRHGRARRRHSLPRRLRGARQAGARRAREAAVRRDSLHRRNSHASSAPARRRAGTMDAGNLLKPALASGALRCIGSTTFADVKQSLRQGSRAVAALPEDRSARAVGSRDDRDPQGPARTLRTHHGVTYPEDALEAAVTLSTRHLKDLHLPDKAIDVIDEAGAAKKLRVGRPPVSPDEPAPGVPVVGVADIEQIVAKIARVPVQAVSSRRQGRAAAISTSS